MSEATNSQALALQHEMVRPNLPLMYQQDDTLWGMIKEKTDVEVVSSRPTRVPMELLAGGKPRQGNPDGGDIGLGSSFTTDYGTLVPVYIFQAWQYTKSAEINTGTKQKAIEDYVTLTQKRAMQGMNVVMECLIQGDGSNTLGTVTGTSGTNILTVDNGNAFQDNWDVDVWSAVGGTKRGTVTIQSVDANNKTLYLTGPFPANTAANDVLLLSGSSGVAGSGIFGIKAYQVNSTSGSVMGLPRASYPGKLSTPTVNAANQALTPSMARRSLAQIQIALGVEKPDELDLIYHMDPGMVAAWEDTGLNVATVIQNQLGGSNSQDMLKKSPPKTFAGRKLVTSINAAPGRIDGLCLKNWFRVENQPIDFYEVGGQTLFPVYGGSGGLQTSTLFYYWTGANVGNQNVREGVYLSNLAIPTGY